jgi:uncharacterized protein (TIGR00369 family)
MVPRMTDLESQSGAELARAWLEHSPLVGLLGLKLGEIAPERAVLVMPYAEQLATVGDLVHGGAIMALMDTAAATAAWSAHDPAAGTKWGTVSATANFLAPARGADLRAVAMVSRRGRTVCFCRVEVADARGGPIAEGLISYRLG